MSVVERNAESKMTDSFSIEFSYTPDLVSKLQGITRHYTYVQTVLSISKNRDEIISILQSGEFLSATGIDTPLGIPRGIRTPDAGVSGHEIQAYAEAIEYLMDCAAEDAPISLPLIQEAHRRLTPGSGGGKLREVQNYVIRMPDRKILYTPPKPETVSLALQAMLHWVKSNPDANPVVVSAVVHYGIARIHPFLDGNGRVARLLANYAMLIGGYRLDHTLIGTDRFFLGNRAEYYEELLAVDEVEDHNRWIGFIAEAWLQSYARLASLVEDLHSSKKTPHQLAAEQEKLANLYRELGGGVVASAETGAGIPQLSREVFIIMAMTKEDPGLDDVHAAIKEVCEENDLKAYRVDDVEDTEKITDKIMESIDSAQFVIADLTHERPNVYYEIGYTHGVNKRVIFTAREGTMLHFDIKDFAVVFYPNITTLKNKLDSKIKAILKKLP